MGKNIKNLLKFFQFSLLTKRDRARTLDDIGRLVDIHDGQRMFEDLQKEAASNFDVSKNFFKLIFRKIWQFLNFFFKEL